MTAARARRRSGSFWSTLQGCWDVRCGHGRCDARRCGRRQGERGGRRPHRFSRGRKCSVVVGDRRWRSVGRKTDAVTKRLAASLVVLAGTVGACGASAGTPVGATGGAVGAFVIRDGLDPSGAGYSTVRAGGAGPTPLDIPGYEV